ncbi:GGDEF domain-containing protein [Sphingomonas glacialis]|uniref:diguanylate cyclase n=1 Tax=Sphingomonas glacialis TaxID=658225 RepID=A0A502FRQ3_9SPHN|nr:sensor domain-containing diguanylate cyclase [Sphingomonas glacialis]TPG52091.1 sensor domain-containing diguanylate cyclase [Sphingomonas glacialis]
MNDGLRFDDDARVAALHRLEVLDTAVEEPFEKIMMLVRTVLSVPIVTVTLVDRDRQWFKAKHGIDQSETPRSVSFCTHTIQQRHPLVVEDALLDSKFADSPLVVGAPHVRSYAGIPLRTPDGYNVGALCAMDTRPRQFSPAEVSILGNFAKIVCDELELRQIARVDYLTGALTRRAFVEQGEREVELARRHGRPSSLVMLDVDHFKRVNDSFGHALGDQVLQQIADIATVALRPNDLFGRLGGEEFALLLPETTGTSAVVVAERLRQRIAERTMTIPGVDDLHVTASFGVAELSASTNSFAAWLESAETMLYAAKTGGRNCSKLAQPIRSSANARKPQ